MAYSKQNFSAEDLQKILNQKWTGHIVVGNKPSSPITRVLKDNKDGTFTLKQNFDSNYKLYKAMLTPGWFPGKDLSISPTLFPMNEDVSLSSKPMLSKLIDLLDSANDYLYIFGIDDVNKQLEKARIIYSKLK